jgi:hypothetical protein
LNGADAAAHHDETVLALAQIFVSRNRDRFETAGNLGRIGMRQHRHRRLALRLLAVLGVVLAVLAVFAGRDHVGPCQNQVVYDTRQLDRERPVTVS